MLVIFDVLYDDFFVIVFGFIVFDLMMLVDVWVIVVKYQFDIDVDVWCVFDDFVNESCKVEDVVFVCVCFELIVCFR